MYMNVLVNALLPQALIELGFFFSSFVNFPSSCNVKCSLLRTSKTTYAYSN